MRRPNRSRRSFGGWHGNPKLARMNRFKWRSVVACAGFTTLCLSARQSLADEQLFGFTRGAQCEQVRKSKFLSIAITRKVMKIKTNNTTRMGMLMALTAITALCMAPPVSAGGGSFYATVTNVTQLIADI